MKTFLIKLFVFFVFGFAALGSTESEVVIRKKYMIIPTYEVMDPDPNPVFFKGRRYQGAQGRIYPYPLLHNLSENLVDKEYHAVIIENQYIEVCILPELGGRVYYAKDKSNGYYFIYYNQVIKPALIGMTGAWISGGIEWNIPHHHRASSFFPVDYTINENADGSKTVWVGETELRHRTKWIAGVTLQPSSTLVEITIRVFNTTAYQNSILIWANAAVHANKNYQVFFPPKTQFATYHKKNQFTEWPLSYQYFDGADYTKGVDVSWWKNIISSTSFFEWGNKGNFVAGIDHGQKAGTVIFGDKFVNPGKKFFSWGNNPFGAMWDELLTDEDGPYFELMFGSFTDNQPDYSWLQTQETKEAKYWFAPLKDISGISKVNPNAVVHLDIVNNTIHAGINVTKEIKGSRIMIFHQDKIIYNESADLVPYRPYILDLENNGLERHNLRIELLDCYGNMLIEYQPEAIDEKPLPEPVSSPRGADEIYDPDSLYFAGLKFEQFHDPYYMPLDFYLKAIELKPDHIPSLVRTGILKLKADNFVEAAKYLEKAVKIVTSDYVVAENANASYYLALAYKEMGKDKAAYELFYRAGWDYNFHSPARYQLALIDSRRGDYHSALEHLRQAYSTNTRSIDILSLKISMYRLIGELDKALVNIDMLLRMDPLNFHAYYEKYIITDDGLVRQHLDLLMRSYDENYLKLAVDYGNAGLVNEALDLLNYYTRRADQNRKDYPMIYYYIGYYNHLLGSTDNARKYFSSASEKSCQYLFPYRFESVRVLKTALQYNKNDAMAWYLIGNIYFDHQPRKAMEAWKRAVSISNDMPVAYRNLAFAYANIDNNPEAAINNIKKAIRLNPDDPRYYYEYDLYQKILLVDPKRRLESFLKNHDVIISDQNSIFTYAELLTVTGNFDLAIELMRSRQFHRWEGGESIYHFWLYSHLFKTIDALENNSFIEAEMLIDAALSYPQNLQSVSSLHENVAFYYRGIIAEKTERPKEAEAYFMIAANCKSSALECKYFAAKSYEKLNKFVESNEIYEFLIKSGKDEFPVQEEINFFDPFSDHVKSKHELEADAYYKIALGYHGLGNLRNANKYFQLAKEKNPALISLIFTK